jgi:hypothetical protein
MKHNSLEANSSSADQEIPRPVWNPCLQEPAAGLHSMPD